MEQRHPAPRAARPRGLNGALRRCGASATQRPYLHDGRAKTLDHAVAFHQGEAGRIAESYFRLSAADRRRIETFLKSLTAPAPTNVVASNSP